MTKKLSSAQKKILLEKETEAPFTGALLHNQATGAYVCADCGTELFSSDTKYDSKTPGLLGWPSFYDVIKAGAVKLKNDNELGMQRTEVSCSKCGGHLGHVFDADDSPNGKHYCINSCALNFKSEDDGTIVRGDGEAV